MTFFASIIASKETQLARLDQCLECPHRKILLGVSKCDLCGCAIRSKIVVNNTKCPDNKW